MSRPNRNQDVLLIETAKKLLPKTGVSAMSLKRIADECGVNLGMFTYHFGNKEEFVRRVMDSIYDDLFAEVEQKSKETKTSVEKIRSILISIALSILEHRKIFASLFQDFLNQDPQVSKFFFEKMSRNIELLVPLVEDAQSNGDFERIPVRQAVAFCMASINMPTLVSEAIDRVSKDSKRAKSSKIAKLLETQLTTVESVHQRVDLALKALSASPRKIL